MIVKVFAGLFALLAAVGAGFGIGRVHTGHHGKPSDLSVTAACSEGNLQVSYTVPPAGSSPLQVDTNFAGTPLDSWIEPAGQHVLPVIVGLPTGDAGLRFSVFAGPESATVFLPSCPPG